MQLGGKQGLIVTTRALVAAVAAACAIGIAGPSAAAAAAAEPVPSLTPAATEELWGRLVESPRPQATGEADCRPLRAVFYAATDWLRLATRLAANPSPCAQYSISVPPLAADKTQLRTGQAAQIRALGPAFHALAEINVTGWTSWVAGNGGSWYEAGVEARRRMAAAGFDVAAGDTWVVNELSSAVRQGTGNARANMRAFLRGLHDGEGGSPARGAVFVIGISQPTSDLSLYQARLQDWYEDAPFWSDVGRYVTDWSQELYGDVRSYAAPESGREERRNALNEYLQHELALAAVAPAAAEAARAFLGGAYSPLANAAWRYDEAFGWTDVPVELMQDYVSAQTYATRSAGGGRFGFAWSPRNLAGVPTAEFDAQTDSLLIRLAAGITDSADVPEAACGPTACAGVLPGAALTTAWRTFATWKPSALAISSPPQTIAPNVPSAPVTIELRTHAGSFYTTGLPVPVELSSTSPTAGFSTSPTGPWTATLATSIATGTSATSVYFRDLQSGTATIVAATPGKAPGTQAVVVAAPETAPPEPTSPAPPAPGGGGDAGAPPPVVTPVTPTPTPTPIPPAPRVVPNAPPTLRIVGRTTSALTRNGRTRQVAVRFSVNERVRLVLRVTPLVSTRPISLLPGTTLADRRSTAVRATMTATVTGGTYLFRARIARPAKGRLYLVRLTAVDGAGATRTLIARVRT